MGAGARLTEPLLTIESVSSGGLVALGLGVLDWEVKDCLSRFKTICQEAFTERLLRSPILSGFPKLRSKYKTRPFEQSLIESFGEDLLFGGPTDQHLYARHVAVTATTDTGEDPLILTNYNRSQTKNCETQYFTKVKPLLMWYSRVQLRKTRKQRLGA
jgi:hypothetical protein